MVSIIHFVRGTSDEARKGFSEALALAKSLSDDQLTAVEMGNLAELSFAEGDVEKAIASGEEAVALRLKAKNASGIANSFTNLTAYRLARGDTEQAQQLAREAIHWARESQSHLMISYVIQHLAVLHAREGNARTGALLTGYVDKLFCESGFTREPTEQWSYDQLMTALRERLKEDEIAALAVEGAVWTEDQAVEEALKSPM